jgi:DHA1 family bicyclomycin/chloramphenicol resistance-like MFS transporter
MTEPARAKPRLPFWELVAITAAAMALNALAVDMMLPALGIIGEELGAARDNDRQLIIIVYVLANGVAQLFFGPLVDRFGRKRVMLWSLAGYTAGSLLSVVASSFTLLLAARAFQGVATAATRVAAVAVVRDQCSGRRMAEVMSLAITIFMAAPILAPVLGQLILFAAPWRWIFIALLAFGAGFAIWIAIRLPETMAPEDRKPLRAGPIAASYLVFVTNRISMGYTLGAAFCFGAVFSYISASEQIFLETFKVGDAFPLVFACVAGALAVATLMNSRMVSHFGMRRLSHSAIFLFIFANVAHLIIASTVGESLPAFMICMMASFFALGLIGPNATALAMEPMGHNAGAAAAINGFAGTTVAGFLGGVVGQFYDGTTMPLIFGFVTLGIAALGIILWTENGKLFGVGEHQPEPAE